MAQAGGTLIQGNTDADQAAELEIWLPGVKHLSADAFGWLL